MGDPQTKLEWALSHANRGWPVFPLQGVLKKGQCSCNKPDCKHPGKHPRTQNGFHDATTDEAQIRDWWRRWPDANIGIPTGPGTFVLPDVDPRHGGDDSLAELIAQHGPLPDTVEAKTGGGGRHPYFQHPGGEVPSQQNLAGLPGLDFKGDGGYVVAVGSGTQQAYTWEASSHPDDIALAPMPEWLRQLVVRRPGSGAANRRNDTGHRALTEEENEQAVELLVANCAFIKNCVEDPAALPRDRWWSMTRTLGCFGSIGAQKAHEYSQPYPGYSEKETNDYLADGFKSQAKGFGPHTCSFVEENLGFPCPLDCQAKAIGALAPAGMASKLILTFSDDGRLPQVAVSNRQLRDMTTDALAALQEANDPPVIFIRSGSLARISVDEKGWPYIEQLGEAALRGRLARTCNFFRFNHKGDKSAAVPPLEVVRDCLSLGVWEVPPLLGITEVPVMRPDGTVVTKPGYDSATNLYYFPSSALSIPDIPAVPTKADFGAAVDLIIESICDFPFDSEASRANAVGAIFTPILRPMIEGPTPLAAIDKPQPGTGASLLAEVISIIATGRSAAMMSAQKDDEGWRKAITSLLLRGQLVVTIDNIDSTLWAPSLAAILTATTFQDRILGRSEMVTLPNRATWIGTGNNIKLAGDLPRRAVWIRLDAKIARPWLREKSSFRHPRLVEWVSDKRGDILAAILTIATAWASNDMPEPTGLPNLGGYEGYSQVIGGVLAYMGVDGFLGNLTAMYDDMDIDTPQWEQFLEAWDECMGDQAFTAADLVKKLNDYDELRAALPDSLADIEVKNYVRRLGNALAKKKGVHFPNGFYIAKAGSFRRAVTWQCVSPKNTDSHGFSLQCESCESDTTPAYTHEDKKVYIDGVKQDSPDSQLALERCESCEDASLKPIDPCHDCGSTDWWQRVDGEWLCSRCHPKPE